MKNGKTGMEELDPERLGDASGAAEQAPAESDGDSSEDQTLDIILEHMRNYKQLGMSLKVFLSLGLVSSKYHPFVAANWDKV